MPCAVALAALALFAAWAGPAVVGTAHAFRVVKDVNSGKPWQQEVVIFEKGKPHDHLELVDANESAQFSYAEDGALVIRITGSKAIKPTIRWKPGGPGNLPESFDAKAFTAVVITGKLTGAAKVTHPNGKVMDNRPDNLWFGPSLVNHKGERVGYSNLADATEDEKTPTETTTMVLPTMLFHALSTNDASAIKGILWPWDATRANTSRDFTLVIDKIAFVK
ncbi:hypothetical protein DB346_18120 [Verrucomicrobia bacterium LW23]|nr:hypothetical protein DB346_18120 [Verrucomicrobia bacterium LW23]